MSKVVKQTCYLCGKTKPIDLFEKDSRLKTEYNRTRRCQECKRGLNNKGHKAFYRFKDRYPDIPIETTKEEVAQLFDVFEGKCAYCNVEESKETGSLQLEHIITPARNGRHHTSNLLIVCRRCNSKKREKPIVEFYKRLPLEHRQTERFILKYVAHFSGMTEQETQQFFKKDYLKWRAEKESGLHRQPKNTGEVAS